MQRGKVDSNKRQTTRGEKESGCQTVEKRKGPKKISDDKIKSVKEYKDYREISHMIWNKDVFKAAFMVVGSPLKGNKSGRSSYAREGRGKSVNKCGH